MRQWHKPAPFPLNPISPPHHRCRRGSPRNRLKVPGSALKALWPLAWHLWQGGWWFSCYAAPAKTGGSLMACPVKKGLILPVTFNRGSEKFPSMKAWIYIYTMVLAAGMVTALAQETKTNTQTSDNISTPNTNRVAVPPPVPAPAVTNEVKPPAVVPLMQTSAVPVQSNITAAPRIPTNAITPLPMTATSAPAPVATNEMKPPGRCAIGTNQRRSRSNRNHQ